MSVQTISEEKGPSVVINHATSAAAPEDESISRRRKQHQGGGRGREVGEILALKQVQWASDISPRMW